MKKRKPYLSTTSIKTYQSCKKKFKFKYIDKIDIGENKTNKYMSFGNSIHMTLADFNMITDKSFKTLANLHNLLRKNWIGEGYDSEDEEREFGLRGLDMLTTYFNEPKDEGIDIFIIEEMIYKETSNFVLCGKLDKVFKRHDHVVEVLDYKTAKTVQAIDQIQLPLYLILAETKLGFIPTSVSLYYLARNEKITQELNDELIEKSTKYILNLCEKICKEEKYESNPNTYCKMNCEFYPICHDAKNNNLIITNSLKQLKEQDSKIALV